MEYLFFILIGLFILFNTITKPRYFWEHRKAKTLRNIFGDRITTVIYLIIGGFITTIGATMGIMKALNINEFLGMTLK